MANELALLAQAQDVVGGPKSLYCCQDECHSRLHPATLRHKWDTHHGAVEAFSERKRVTMPSLCHRSSQLRSCRWPGPIGGGFF